MWPNLERIRPALEEHLRDVQPRPESDDDRFRAAVAKIMERLPGQPDLQLEGGLNGRSMLLRVLRLPRQTMNYELMLAATKFLDEHKAT